jgi:hypothetical protein
MAIHLALALIQNQSSNQAARATAADLARAQTQARVDLVQAQAEMARAQAEARVAQAEARRALAEAARGRAGFLMVDPRGGGGPTRRQEAMMFTGFLVVTMAAVVIFHPIARALGRRLEGGARRESKLDVDASAQLQRIEHTVEAMAIEIERLSEGQRFTTKLLASRADAESLIPRN